MLVAICFDGQGLLCIRVLRSPFDLHASVEATLCAINGDIEFRGAKVMPSAQRLCLFVGFWHPAEPLPVHAPSPPVTEHPHPIACRQPTLDDLGQAFFDRQVSHPNSAIEVKVRTAEGALAVHAFARQRIRFVSDVAHRPFHAPLCTVLAWGDKVLTSYPPTLDADGSC